MIRECIFCGSVLFFFCQITWRVEFLVPSQSHQTQSSPFAPRRKRTAARSTLFLSSYCSISLRSSVNRQFSHWKKPVVDPAPPLHRHNLLAFSRKAGFVLQRSQIGTCTDRSHMWTWIFWCFCITQSTAWHDRHIEPILTPCNVQVFNIAATTDMIVLFPCCLSCQVLDWVKVSFCFCFCFFCICFFFRFCAMFSPLVA